VPVGLLLLLVWRMLFIVLSVKFSYEMVGASILYNDGGIGCVYETKDRPLRPDVHSIVSSACAATFIFAEKFAKLCARKIFFTFPEIVPFLVLEFIKGKKLGL